MLQYCTAAVTWTWLQAHQLAPGQHVGPQRVQRDRNCPGGRLPGAHAVQEHALVPRAILAHAQRGLALRAMAGVQGLGFLHCTAHAVQENALAPRAVLAHAQRGLALRAIMTGVQGLGFLHQTAHAVQGNALVPRAVLARAQRGLALRAMAGVQGLGFPHQPHYGWPMSVSSTPLCPARSSRVRSALLPSATFTATSLQDDSKPYNLL